MSKPEAPKRSRLMDALQPPRPVHLTGAVELPDPPPVERPTNNLDRVDKPEEVVNLNFKVPKSFHRTYKLIAGETDMKMQDLLQESLDFYIEANAERFGDVSPAMQRRLAEIVLRKSQKG